MFWTGQHGYSTGWECMPQMNRNGVLFYLAVRNKEFAIIGDGGINAKVPENFWDKTKSTVLKHFRQEKYAEGLIEGILMAGNQLKEHFPRKKMTRMNFPMRFHLMIPNNLKNYEEH